VLPQHAVVGVPEPVDPPPLRATNEAGVAAAKTGRASVAKMGSLENILRREVETRLLRSEVW
jgi:hypothetical protein